MKIRSIHHLTSKVIDSISNHNAIIKNIHRVNNNYLWFDIHIINKEITVYDIMEQAKKYNIRIYTWNKYIVFKYPYKIIVFKYPEPKYSEFGRSRSLKQRLFLALCFHRKLIV